MRSWLWQGGVEFVPCDSVPIADRGFRYGMSVFESFRVVNGAPLFLPEHLDRLEKACLSVGFATSPPPARAVIETLQTDACPSALARLCITAGDPDGPGRVLLYIEDRPPFSEELRSRGYRLGIEPAPYQPLFGGLKTGNYWANAAAFSRAKTHGDDEAVLLDVAGAVVSASMANLFLVRGGRIAAPPLTLGARDGVVRNWVRKHREVLETVLTASDLHSADEIFLTNSWIGIVPAASLDGRPLPSRSTALALHAEYDADIGRNL